MNGKKMSGEITGREVSGKKMIGMNTNNTSEEMTGTNMTGNSMPVHVLLHRATQVDHAGSSKKKFPTGWLLSVVALGLFLGHFWSYISAFHGIVSLFVFSKFLAGVSGTHFLL